jgi:predicted transcriptional regulator
MFGWFSNKKRVEELDDKTQRGFSSVRDDMNAIGKWIKHLDKKDKQVFDIVFTLKEELSTLKEEIESLREGVELAVDDAKNKQVFKKLPVLNEQTAVQDVQDAVQTSVQTGNFHGILHGLSGNERLVVMTLMNSDMKLSYEDLALLLGKERSTVRGQVNSIKQKSEGLIQELIEKNGKKRVYVPEDVKEKMQKYAKVRGGEKRRNKR